MCIAGTCNHHICSEQTFKTGKVQGLGYDILWEKMCAVQNNKMLILFMHMSECQFL